MAVSSGGTLWTHGASHARDGSAAPRRGLAYVTGDAFKGRDGFHCSRCARKEKRSAAITRLVIRRACTKDVRLTAEERRLSQARGRREHWYRWGSYLSERQWGTVREDYSADGNAWAYLPHDHARSRAYRWGEDGIAGLCDNHQRLCFAIALWNGADPILKERLFGLSGPEGNHCEDVKERYFHLDNTPSHAYMEYLYEYPQRVFPYAKLVEENQERGKAAPEFEIDDTDAFADDRYFQVYVRYAKASPEDILIDVRVVNRGAQPARLHVLPTLWFRNTLSWRPDSPKPLLGAIGSGVVETTHETLGRSYLHCERPDGLLFTETRRTANGFSASRTRRRLSKTHFTRMWSRAARMRSTRSRPARSAPCITRSS